MNREQELIDIMFQVALLISDKKFKLYKKSNEEKAEWVARQLRSCGFDTSPCGASWGVLKRANLTSPEIVVSKGLDTKFDQDTSWIGFRNN